jgi:bifunctional enzyme CysN/CysC
MTLTHLQRLESESIQILREVVAEAEKSVMLYSMGADSSVLLHLARKAFYPARPPFPLLHVDSTWNFREMYEMRDRVAAEAGMNLLVYVNPDALAKGINPFAHGPAVHTELWKIRGLEQALAKYGFDVALGGGRREEERPRAEPRRQPPALWRPYNAGKAKDKRESIRVFPLSNWTEQDLWQYIYRENIPVVPLYYARERSVVERDGAILMMDDERMPLRPGERAVMRKVRFPTLGCYPLSGGVESSAATPAEVVAELIGTQNTEPISARLKRSLLRFRTCGGAGDGKSTLIARLLGEAKAPVVHPRPPEGDVAYRFFGTERRNFIVADAPGHGITTPGRFAGAATADLSVVLVDANKGVLPETRRDSFLASLLGNRHVVLAVNKMDLVGHSQAVFREIEKDYRRFAEQLGLPAVTCIPVSALHGDNVLGPSEAMPWYDGPTLLGLLESVEIDEARLAQQPLRLQVQWVIRRSPDFLGYAGTLVAGRLCKGDALRVQPSGRTSRVGRIITSEGEFEQAVAGQAITLTLTDDVDASRGDLIVLADQPAEVADQFEATVIWMDSAPLLPGRSYLLKIGTRTVTATITPLKYKVNVETLQRMAATTLEQSEIGVCNLQLDRSIAFDAYKANRDTGGFILIDRLSNETVGAGMLHFALRRAKNVHWQALDVNRAARAANMGQTPCLLWYTGLSGAGKSTIANLVDKRLHASGRHTYVLDGDNVRHGLNKDLGFTDADRVENIRRIAEVAKLMVDAGLIVGAAFISPFRAERQMARALLNAGEFIEIFVDAPLGIAEQRDPKGLYKKARRGDLKNFTGIDSPYEPPEEPELRIDTTNGTPEDAAETIVAFLRARGAFDSD